MNMKCEKCGADMIETAEFYYECPECEFWIYYVQVRL